jgi:hypothetical protein
MIKRFSQFMAGKNEDFYQEGLLCSWRGLLKDPKATGGYLRTRIKWRIRDVAISGSSVDKHHTTRDDIEIVKSNYPVDIDENLCWEYLTNRYQPLLEDQIIDKLDTSRFLNSLDANEQDLVRYKLEGMRDDEVRRELHVSYKRYYEIKRGLRPKIAGHFSA